MKIFNNFSQLSFPKVPTALTIGNFDGVHLGHQTLLRHLRQTAEQTIVFTFSNHPSEILHKTTTPYLTTLPHRLELFEKIGIDNTILIPFSESFSKKTAKVFLTQLKETIPFTHLILGHDAVIGHDRKNNLYELSEQLAFSLEYLEPVLVDGKIISSSEIRKCILSGHLTDAGHLLGRPYSIFATVQHGCGKGRSLGFHTANLSVEKLTIPPLGVYAVDVKIQHETFLAVANLGHAPTLHKNRPPYLEVHLIDEHRDLYGEELEVFFLNYLRPEKCFPNLGALQSQIQQDILNAKACINYVKKE
jgi:riboflavin kinase / FMN adenylyltransferase